MCVFDAIWFCLKFYWYHSDSEFYWFIWNCIPQVKWFDWESSVIKLLTVHHESEIYPLNLAITSEVIFESLYQMFVIGIWNTSSCDFISISAQINIAWTSLFENILHLFHIQLLELKIKFILHFLMLLEHLLNDPDISASVQSSPSLCISSISKV